MASEKILTVPRNKVVEVRKAASRPPTNRPVVVPGPQATWSLVHGAVPGAGDEPIEVHSFVPSGPYTAPSSTEACCFSQESDRFLLFGILMDEGLSQNRAGQVLRMGHKKTEQALTCLPLYGQECWTGFATGIIDTKTLCALTAFPDDLRDTYYSLHVAELEADIRKRKPDYLQRCAEEVVRARHEVRRRPYGPTVPLVLVVARDAKLRTQVAQRTRQLGYDVIDVGDGWSALQRTYRHRPELIISEVEIPEVPGWGMVGHLRDDPAMCQTGIIILTGFSAGINETTSRGYGVDAWLEKPVDLEDIDLYSYFVLRARGHTPVHDRPRQNVDRSRVLIR